MNKPKQNTEHQAVQTKLIVKKRKKIKAKTQSKRFTIKKTQQSKQNNNSQPTDVCELRIEFSHRNCCGSGAHERSHNTLLTTYTHCVWHMLREKNRSNVRITHSCAWSAFGVYFFVRFFLIQLVEHRLESEECDFHAECFITQRTNFTTFLWSIDRMMRSYFDSNMYMLKLVMKMGTLKDFVGIWKKNVECNSRTVTQCLINNSTTWKQWRIP